MAENKVYTAIGMMSGTSLDGVDAALIETDGYAYVKPLGFVTIPYKPEVRAQIRACFGDTDTSLPRVTAASDLVAREHAEGVSQLLHQLGRKFSEVDVIGFHGQTIFHAPKQGVTIQIGNGDWLAQNTNIPVVDTFRENDVKHGGEGAPLAPLYHWARVHDAGLEGPVVILNIGGVGNVTWIGNNDEDILAFDTGPGNALMDDWVNGRTGALFDKDGATAARGTARDDLVQAWLNDPYFTRLPPKSMDRDQWDIAGLGKLSRGLNDLSTEDGAATFLKFTAESIVRSVKFMPHTPKHWYACGGGRHNKELMRYLGQRLREEGYGQLHSVDDLGWNGDATEAECFAYLAVRSLLGEFLSLPTTTGVPKPVTGGVVHQP